MYFFRSSYGLNLRDLYLLIHKLTFTECGGMLTEQRGVITSPNFPKKYPNNLNCVWTIHRPYEFIEMLFLDFLLQQNDVDNVYIYEGINIS